LDDTALLGDEETNYYQSQISILRWMVELGRLDIYVHVALLSSYLVQPRRGHLEAIYNIYGYLKQHTKPRGMPGQINTFVDANRAHNRVTPFAHWYSDLSESSSYFMWYSKAQATVESSTFGSEFIAKHQVTDMIEGLRYKLRMLGVPLEGSANVLSVNKL
jgi:hypothetical protein